MKIVWPTIVCAPDVQIYKLALNLLVNGAYVKKLLDCSYFPYVNIDTSQYIANYQLLSNYIEFNLVVQVFKFNDSTQNN